jgi:pilus assembly protein CpaD
MKLRLSPPLWLCLGLGLVLAACTPEQSEWSNTAAPKQAKVDYQRVRHVTAFVPGSKDLARGEAQSLMAFLDESEVTPDDRVYLETGTEDGLTAQRIGTLVHEIGKRGIGATTLPEGTAPANSIVVTVERYVVTPPQCPNWTSPTYGDHGNQLTSNFGCADATNFSLMVADPHDLVIGRHMDPDSGDAATSGVTRYRDGKPKPLLGVSASSN